ncbi:hypothetical protein GCM10027186_05170 [Micromonospora schwarzwaldensis]
MASAAAPAETRRRLIELLADGDAGPSGRRPRSYEEGVTVSQWQVPLPESVKVAPATGMNCHT